MSTIGWILLIVLFLSAHMLMHRGHGGHGARGPGSRAPTDGAPDASEGGARADATGEAPRHTHRGC